MKKIILATIVSALLAFSACIPTFASDEPSSIAPSDVPSYTTSSTFGDISSDGDTGYFGERDIIYSDRTVGELPPDRIELTDEEKLKLAQEYIAQYRGYGDAEKCTVLCFKTLSNGLRVIYVEPEEWEYNLLLFMSTIGKYLYRYGDGKSVKLYQNGVYTEFSDAYESGMIDDAILEELNEVMHFDSYADQTETTQPEETSTAPKTNTQGDATVDSVYTGDSGTNGAIATGDNDMSLAIIIAVSLAAAAGIVAVLKRTA